MKRLFISFSLLSISLLTLATELSGEFKDSTKLALSDSLLLPSFQDMQSVKILDEAFSEFSKTNFLGKSDYLDSSVTWNAEFVDLNDSIIRNHLNILDQNTPFALSYNERVKAFINLYGNKKRILSAKVMGLQDYYFPLIEEILDKYDMPYEMKYLAIVESALNPTANSRAGAKGLWQFMYATGKMYDLNVTSYTDDRFDPYLSTEAACKYLSYLNKYYDDWNLALAAYNCGPGNVNKAIRRSGGKKGYWEIYPHLPRETRGYVPAFIAVNYVLNYPGEFNIKAIKPPTTHFDNDTIHIKGPVSFSHLASTLTYPLEKIEYLNPVYKLSMIPNDGKFHVLKLPNAELGVFLNNQDSILALYKSKNVDSEEVLAAQQRLETYRVRSGDYLGKIASRYNVSVRDIKEWNGLRSNNLKIGQRLTIYSKGNAPKPSASKTKITTTSSAGYEYYTIRSGDTLWDIAKAKGLTTAQIKTLNRNLNERKLKPGDKIIVGKKG
jgi:membrane-bound lytic murein transglycosylase D